MPSPHFKGKTLVENLHLSCPYHALNAVRRNGVSRKPSLDDNLIVHGDFIMTLKPDDLEGNDEYHQVFVVETKGLHLKSSEDTNYKRSVFDICNAHSKKADWAEFVPAMQRKAVRFEVVDEEEWERKLGDVLAA